MWNKHYNKNNAIYFIKKKRLTRHQQHFHPVSFSFAGSSCSSSGKT